MILSSVDAKYNYTGDIRYVNIDVSTAMLTD